MPFYRSVRGFLEGILLFCIAYIQPLAAQSGPYLEVDGLLIMEAENTASQLDSDSNNPWVSLSPGDNHYEDGATGEEYIEFAGNGPAGGDPRSPLEYTFKINKGGNYAMAFRSHKRLQGQPDDRCNDAYVRMAGNFDRADRDETNRPTWNVSNLEIDKKIYLSGEGHGWGVAGTLEHLEQVNNRHRPARYKFIAGETYTLTVSGRSERYGIDRIIFWHDDLADEFAKDSALEESLREGDPNAGLPIADAGSDQVITLPDGDVTLDGSNSSDPGGNIDSYLWTQLPGGPNTAILSGETTDTLSASGLIEGTYVFELTVTDSDNNTASDTVTVTVAEASAAVIKGDLMRWHKVTLELDGPPATETGATNPFADYRMIVTFTHPGTGLTYNVPGYFAADGDAANTSATSGNKWHAHLSPDEIGHWDYTISFREGTDVAVDSSPDAGTVMPAYDGLSGSFTVSETDKTGRDFRAKGRLTYVGENYLQFSGTGEYFIKAGSDSPENLLAYDDFDDTPNALTGPKGDREYRKTWNPHAGDYSALDASDYTWDNGRGTELLGALRYLGELEGLNSFSFITFTVDADDDNVFPHLLRSDVAGYESIPQDNDDESPTGGRWGHPTHGLHPDRFDVSKLAQWGLIMDYATKKGMFMDIKTQEEENDRKMDGGSLGLERKLYYRELIARFGHNLGLQWNLGEEVNYHSEFNDQEQDRIKSFAEYFQANDPYNHLLTVHSLAGQDDQDDIYDPLLGNQSVLTGASVQTTAVDLTDVFTSAKKWSEASNQAGTPWVVFIDEPGSAAYGVKTDNDGLTKQHDTWTDGVEYEESEKHEYARKNALWGSIMGGSAGINFYFGFLSRKYDGSDEGQSDQWAENFRSRDLLWDYARYMLEFFEINEIPVTEMSNYGNLTPALGSWVFAKPGDTYMVYLRDGGSETLDLSGVSGTFDVSWYDPRNGGAMQNGSVTSIEGGSTVSLGDAPNTSDNDWLVLVQKPTVSGPADPYNLQAIVDFPDIDAGAVPYTVDGARNALQIDATVEENRGPFARATTTFFGEAGSYDVTIATIGEYDGESQYRFYVNGVQVGTTVTNDSTNQGFDPQTHVIATGVQIPAGATLAVESNAASNGEVLEGDPPEPAWARGRWTGLSFTQVNTPPAGPAVVSLTLVNATTDQPVPGFDPIPNGAVINTVDIGTTNLNIIASTDPDSDFGSVVFSLSGAEAHNQTESVMPFVLYGDAGSGDYNDNTFDNGTYTLSATPYDDNGGAGNAGETYSIDFTVTDLYSLEITNGQGSGNYSEGEVIDITADAAPAGQVFSVWTGDTSGVADVNSSITTFTMPAADVTLTATYVDQVPVVDSFTITNMDGFENITGDITIDIANGGKQRVAIKANTTPETDFGSVQFSLTGATTGGRGDNNPDYEFKSWNHVPGDIYKYGDHTLVITPYDTDDVAGTALTVNISVTNSQLTDYQMWESNHAIVGLASADTDGDGVKNYFEYLSATDPNDPVSKGFKLAASAQSSGAPAIIEWAVAEGYAIGVDYIVEASVDLSEWVTLDLSEYTVTDSVEDGMRTVSIELHSTGSKNFVRLSQPE